MHEHESPVVPLGGGQGIANVIGIRDGVESMGVGDVGRSIAIIMPIIDSGRGQVGELDRIAAADWRH
jgi:hypothetical protein